MLFLVAYLFLGFIYVWVSSSTEVKWFDFKPKFLYYSVAILLWPVEFVVNLEWFFIERPVYPRAIVCKSSESAFSAMLRMGFPINIVGGGGERIVYNENDFITHARQFMSRTSGEGILLEPVLSFKINKQWSSNGDVITSNLLNK